MDSCRDHLLEIGLVIITGGIDSVVYWVFLVLVVRNAISIPIAVTQLTVNLMTVGCYVASMYLWYNDVLPSTNNAGNMTDVEWRRFTPSYTISTNKFDFDSPVRDPSARTNQSIGNSGISKVSVGTASVDASLTLELKNE